MLEIPTCEMYVIKMYLLLKNDIMCDDNYDRYFSIIDMRASVVSVAK